MRNLAGVATAETNAVISRELAAAGVVTVETPPKDPNRLPEVKATVAGAEAYADGSVTAFTRMWYYWAVHTSKPMPYADALVLEKAMGREVRAFGMSGGGGLTLNEDCDSWHVDTQEGLNALATALRNQRGTGPRPTTAQVRTYLLNSAFY